MIKNGDKVRFVVKKPSYYAVYTAGEMTVIDIRDEKYGTVADVRYPPTDDWMSNLHQGVLLTDLELVK